MDCRIWNPDLSGCYEDSSDYDWLIQRMGIMEDNQDSWRWVWRLPTTEKCRFLVWLICHDALPTNCLRSSRGLGSSPTCGRCHNSLETALHCLRDCTSAMRVWHILRFVHEPGFFANVARVWIKTHVSMERGISFLSTLWWGSGGLQNQ